MYAGVVAGATGATGAAVVACGTGAVVTAAATGAAAVVAAADGAAVVKLPVTLGLPDWHPVAAITAIARAAANGAILGARDPVP